jgi:hypothetical protein
VEVTVVAPGTAATRLQMPFPARSPKSPTIARSSGPVFGVGRQLFVNCSGREDRAPFFDDKGAPIGSLIDGAEVEVMGWMPRGAATRYLVRATHIELLGWLDAASLRTTRAPRAPEAVSKSAVAAAWIAPQPATSLAKRAGRASRKKA